jgi:putative ABC transport system permease protein
MRWLFRLRRQLFETLRPGQAERDVEDELRDHLAREIARQHAQGASEADARRLARVRIGNVRASREAVADARPLTILTDAAADLRIGARGLRRTPGFALAVVLSLALGVGGTTAMYAVVQAVLIRELPYASAEELHLARVWWNDFSSSLSAADYLALQERRDGTARVGGFSLSDEGFTLSTPQGPEVINGGSMTAELPGVLGIAPIVGPGFSSDPRVREVMIGESLWRTRYSGSRDVIGRIIALDGDPYHVVGVMPPGFNLPGARDGAAWIKLQPGRPTWRGPFFLGTVVRVPSMSSADAVAARLTALATPILRERYGITEPWRYGLRPLKEAVVGDIRETLILLLSAMALVLLIAVVNVSNLMLARGTVRAREVAVRASLGASRGRLVRQVVTESALLGSIGGAFGLLLAAFMVNAAGRFAAAMVPRMEEVRVDAAAVAFALACGLAAGIAAALLPALRMPWRHLLTALRESGRTASASPGHGRTRQVLVVAEIALTVMVVAGAMLLAKSLFRLESVDPGFRPEGVLTFRLSLPNDPYANDEREAAFLATLDDRLRSLPGVSSVAFAMALPPDRLVMSNNYTLEGDVQDSTAESGVAEWTLVSPDYFAAMGIRLMAGRPFAAGDRAAAPPVAIVNESFVRKHFPDGRAIGRRLKGGKWNPSIPWTSIVGIAADVPYGKGVGGGSDATVYVPFAQGLWWQSPYVIVRAAGDLTRLVAPVRQAVAAIDSNLALRDIATMEERLRLSTMEPRVRSVLFALLAGLALTLAATGIYGVMSYHVNQRRRETAIRRALGARAGDVIATTVFSGLRLAAAGIAIGTVGALGLGRSLSTVLFQVSPHDPGVLAAVAVLLAACALVACAVPALRMASVDPASVLRDE